MKNNITLNIEVGWGDIAGQTLRAGSAAGGTNGDVMQNYATVVAELKANVSGPAAVSLSLPTSNPFGTANYDVSGAQQKAWGLVSGSANTLDGALGVSSSGWPSTDYVAVLLHEITHVMGRNSGWGGTNGDTTPLDLFRYSAPGVLATDGSLLDPARHPGATALQYFSINGGQTVLADYANTSDYGDWATNSLTATDPMNAFLANNSNILTAVDIVQLGAMGYQLTTAAAAVVSNSAGAAAQMTQAVAATAGLTTYGSPSSITSTMQAQLLTSLTSPHNAA